MAVEDFRIHVGFTSHPKTVKLIRRLGLAAPWALLELWAWATQHRPAGELSGMSDEDIEIAGGWAGEPGVLVAALVDVGYLDRVAGGCNLHDWCARQPWVVEAPARSARAIHGGHCRQGVRFSKSCPVCRSPATRKRVASGSSAGAQKPLSPSPFPSSPIRTNSSSSQPSAATLPTSSENSAGKQRVDPSPEAVEVAKYLADAIHSHSPAAKLDPAKWARDVDLAIRVDRRSPASLRAVIDYAHRNARDTFWRANLLSGRKLREKFDTIAIKAAARPTGPPEPPPPITDNRYRKVEPAGGSS